MKKILQQTIFLIGPMGAGKSSVGKCLAEQLEMNFYDSDEEMEKRTGVDIGWIYDLEGEAGFHRRETAIIQELASFPNTVLATGGASVLVPEVRDILEKNGIIIFLDVSLEYQHNRTVNESRRPLLRVDNRAQVIEELYQQCLPFYTALSDYYILTDNRSVKTVTDNIIEWVEARGPR